MVARFDFIYAFIVELWEYCGTCTNNLGDSNCVWNSFKLVSHIMKCQYKSGARQ